MKKIITFLMVAVMFFCSVPMVGQATNVSENTVSENDDVVISVSEGNTEISIYLNEGFEALAGTDGYSANGNENDYMIIEQTQNPSGVVDKVFDISATGITTPMILEYKIKLASKGDAIQDDTWTPYLQNYFADLGGTSKSYGDHSTKRVPFDEEWHRIIFKIEPGQANGVFIIDETTITSAFDFSTLTDIAQFWFRMPTNASSAKVYIDDFRAYSGTEVLEDEYFNPPLEDEQTTTIYLDEGFEALAGTDGYSANGNKNDYMIIEQTQNPSGVVDKVFDISATGITTPMILEYKIKLASKGDAIQDDTWTPYLQNYFADLGGTSKSYGDHSTKRVPFDEEWHRIIFKIEPGQANGVFIIDETTITSAFDFSTLTDIAQFWFRMPTNASSAKVYIDDFRAYSGTEVLEDEYFNPPLEDEQTTTIYLDEGFEALAGTDGYSANGNKNDYMIIEQTQNPSGVVDKVFDISATGITTPMILEYKIKLASKGDAIQDDTWTPYLQNYFADLGGTSKSYGDHSTKRVPFDEEWHRIIFKIEPGQANGVFIIDETTITSAFDFSTLTDIAQFWFRMPTNASSAKVYIDDFRAYSGTEVLEDEFFNSSVGDEEEPVITYFVKDDYESSAGLSGYSNNGDENDYMILQQDATPVEAVIKEISISEEGITTPITLEYKVKLNYKDDSLTGAWTSYLQNYFGNRLSSVGDISLTRVPFDGNWHHVMFVIEPGQKNGVFIIDEQEISSTMDFSFLEGLTRFQFRVPVNVPNTEIFIDDFMVYGNGDYSPENPPSGDEEEPNVECIVVTDNTASIEALGNSVAMAVNNDEIYYGRELHQAAKAIFKDNVALFPVTAFAEAYGLTVNVDGSNVTVTDASSNSKTIAVTLVQNVPYFTVEDLTVLATELLDNKVVTYEERGFVVIADTAFTSADATRKEVLHYLLYDRPLEEDIKAAFTANSSNQHPRILIDKETYNELPIKYQSDATIKEWGDEIIANADVTIKLGLPTYELSSTGQIISQCRTVYDNAKTLGLAYILTGDSKYVDRLYNLYEAVAQFPDWNASFSFLDTAEMIAGFAIGYDWLYDVWTAEQKEFIEDTMYNMGVKPGYDIYYNQIPGAFTWWANTLSNWNVVCNGGMIMGAVALFDKYPDMCADIVEIGTRGIEKMLDEFYPSGAWSEGPMYWAYTMDYTQNMFSTLEACFGTMFNLENAPALNRTLDFYLATDGPTGVNNFHDATNSLHMNSECLTWLGQTYGSADAMSVRKAMIDQGITPVQVSDVLYYDESLIDEATEFQKDWYLRDTEMVSMRESFENFESTWLSFHAGAASYSHSHLDTGTYVVDMLGQRWAIDLGSDNYSLPQYHDAFTAYRKRPEGHNLYVINPAVDSENYMGQSTTTFIEVQELACKEKGAYAYIDLTTAYERDVISAKRGYMLADDRRSAVIRDEITFKAASNEFYWFNHINEKTTAEVVNNNTVILRQNGQAVKLMIDTNLTDYEVSVVDAVPLPSSPVVNGQNANNGIKKIQIHSTNASESIYVQVKFIPLDDANAEMPMENIAIENWTIPDGELTVLPTAPVLSAIYNGGEAIGNFETTKLLYEVPVVYNETKVPVITAEAGTDCNITVIPAETLSDETLIKVSWKDCPESVRTYHVKFKFLDKLDNIGEWTRLQVFGVTTNSEPEANHPATNVSDNSTDAESRWSAPGEAWVCLNLGSKKSFSALGISWWKGNPRNYSFDIEISDDGINFTKLLEDYKSSGTTDDIEIFELDEAISAKYVRYMAYGSNEGSWSSVTELAILTKEDNSEGNETGDSGEIGDSTQPGSGDNTGDNTQPGSGDNTGDSTQPGNDNNLGGNQSSTSDDLGLTVSNANIPSTGDDTNLSLWLLFLLVAIGGCGLFATIKKVNNK